MSDSDKKLLESSLLKKLNDDGSIGNSREFLHQLGRSSLTHELFDGVLRSLTALEIVATKAITTEGYQLTEEGKNYLEKGTPEVQLFHLVRDGSSASSAAAAAVSACGVSATELESKLGEQFAIARNQSMKKKWLKYDKSSNTFALNVDTITDEINPLLKKVAAGEKMDEKLLKELKDRKMIAKYSITSYSIAKGSKFTLERKKVATDLTTELIKSGDWEKSEFKEYNVAPGELNEVGCLHPLLKVREEFRIILLEMGFSEMPTARFVESSFWNFDALFQPQQHPARDSHDTFFLKNPAKTVRIDQEYLKKVKDMHEKGDNISLGYRYDWKLEEAEKNILRTHTTAISTRMLYQLAKKKPFQPTKMFSIDRVFRNETLDATHLAEFHQVEGLIADRNLTLGDLMGVIHTFFTKIGMTELRFKPAYNPYTEPSMEIFAKSPELGRWIEIGNSGIFRPEMLRPMGLSEDVTVIAWGLSLERPTMIKYGLGNIRKLFGPGVSLKVIKDNGIARFDNPNALVDQVGQE